MSAGCNIMRVHLSLSLLFVVNNFMVVCGWMCDTEGLTNFLPVGEGGRMIYP